MKITPQQYARVLVESVKKNNISGIAKSFWYKLQKNGQYKDLSKIISALDEEYAKLNNVVLAQVYSEKILNQSQIEDIESKLKGHFKKEVMVNNIININQTAGVIVKIDDTEIDLSLENKINKLKQALNAV